MSAMVSSCPSTLRTCLESSHLELAERQEAAAAGPAAAARLASSATRAAMPHLAPRLAARSCFCARGAGSSRRLNTPYNVTLPVHHGTPWMAAHRRPLKHVARRLLPVVLAAASSSSSLIGASADEPTPADSAPKPTRAWSRKLQVSAVVAAVAAAAAVGLAVAGGAGGPSGVVAAVAKSGFTAAFSLIFVSEIGDKTFFIAALLAMRHSKLLVLSGAVAALGIMSAISAAIGRLFRQVPAQLHTTVPVGEYLACALLVWFGIRSIQSALALPSTPAATAAAAAGAAAGAAEAAEEDGELAEAREYVEKAEAKSKIVTPFEVFWESFSLIFVAEWGDRSMLATIALGAAQSPVGVALGATAGHLVATGIAVVGGALLSRHISERLVGIVGGVLFLVFAAATLFGVF